MTGLGRVGYFLVLAVCAAAFTTAAVVAQRRRGGRALALTTVVGAAVLLTLGYLDWRGLAIKETPLIAYILAAVLPTTSAALLIYRIRRYPMALQWFVGTASFVVVTLPSLVVGTYFLSMWLPF